MNAPDLPATPEPGVPATPEPEVPATPEPEVPATPEPEVPATSEPEVPATSEPEVPATSEPEVPATSSSSQPPRRRAPLRDNIETLLVAILVVLFVTTFIAQNSVIPTASMEDTLLIGDYLLVDKVVFAPEDGAAPATWLAQRPLRHGDVIVFKFPHDPGTDYIKRVIGLPGDVISVRDKRVFRNGDALDEPYKRNKTSIIYPLGSPEGNRDNLAPVTVPPDSFFVMGDNRDYSADSREWAFVPRSHVEGRAFVIFWSRAQRPGSWQIHGTERMRRFLQGLRTFQRDTRWHRLGTIVR